MKFLRFWGKSKMTKEKYIRIVLKNLKCSYKEKKRIAEDLNSDFDSAMENGETYEDVIARLGKPTDLAQELNEDLQPVSPVKKWIIRIVGIVLILGIILYVCIKAFIPDVISIEDSKVFDQQKLIQKTEEVLKILDEGDYQQLISLCDEKMKKGLSQEKLSEAIDSLGERGAYEKMTSQNFVCVDGREKMATGEVVALYQQRSVTYTISFNEDYQLTGLYMK